MKTKTPFLLLFLVLPLLGKAQCSLGLSGYYGLKDNSGYSLMNPQFGFGWSVYKQMLPRLDEQFKILGLITNELPFFVDEATVAPIPQGYEHAPSIFELDYLVRLHSMKAHKRMHINLGSGFCYRWTVPKHIETFTNDKGRRILAAPNLNHSIGIPLAVVFQFDINKHLSIALEDENRYFISLKNPFSERPFSYNSVNFSFIFNLFNQK
jgi:hypothetical protein